MMYGGIRVAGRADFHLQNIHCWISRDLTKLGRTAVKHSCLEEDKEMPHKCTRRAGTDAGAGGWGKVVPGSFVFVDQTVNFVPQSACILNNHDMANG
ncbi:hypothetical protein AcV7_009485 [Taiwanofungus camphoratus]|nr:hypothetical protein AcW2_003972 [Antrodia cinnamomea]KAI0948851.1 hypothetical protein AcV7_009485 [Antrodia cinnamomea]